MNGEKIMKNIKPFAWVILALVVILVFSRQIKGLISGIKSILNPFGSSNNLDRLNAGANAQVTSMNRSPLVPTIQNQSDANTIQQILDTYYGLDFITNIASSSLIREADAQRLQAVLVNGKSGQAIAGTIKAYGARTLPNRTGSLTGIFYNNSLGTLRDHVSRYTPAGATQVKTLAYIDKVTNDYLR